MPNVNLTNDEYHRVMTERTAATLVNGVCEDYPCCGHTEQDPCRREWYDHPDAFNPLVNPHCFCEHEYGICDVDMYDDEVADPRTCEHEETRLRRGRLLCDLCESDLMYVTDVHSLMYPSKAVPGLFFEIPVIGLHLEIRDSLSHSTRKA